MTAYGYVRASTLDQALTIKAQDTKIVQYCAFKGLDLGNIYTDHGVSGGTPLAQRPRGQALLRILEPGDHVVITKLDRAWRNTRDCLDTVERWTDRDITLHVITDGIHLDTAVGKLMFKIVAAFAEFERDMISQRTKEGLAASTKRLGNPAWGELPGEKELEAYVKSIRKETSLTLDQIAQRLMQEGYQNRRGNPYGRKEIWKMCQNRHNSESHS